MSEDFDAPVRTEPGGADIDQLVINIEGYEGPLDVLLALAQSQKVDLTKISILPLVEQYLTFITAARHLKLELAADYLVMAAWLTFLKSKLLLPVEEDDEDGPSAAEMAARLAFQLQRLEAIRGVAARLMARDRLARDTFRRGQPQQLKVIKTPSYEDELIDLLRAYTNQRVRAIPRDFKIHRSPAIAIEDARHRIEAMLGRIPDWSGLELLILPIEDGHTEQHRSAMASTFAATLEMVRDGFLDIRQMGSFGPIFVRKRPPNESTNTGQSDNMGGDQNGSPS